MRHGQKCSYETRAKISAKLKGKSTSIRKRYPVPDELLEDYKIFKHHGYTYAEALEMARASLKKKPAP